MSIGIAIYPSDGIDAATLIDNADAALYRAKAQGLGAICFFEPGMDKRLRERREILQELRDAVPNGELELHYQPQAKIGGKVVGFEALVRWNHPTRGMVPAGTFIPIAEESGLILPIGEWVLREACREAASWPRHLQIAVNLSPAQFHHGDLPGLVHSILLETGLSAGQLELEITEGVLIGDFSRASSILRRLKALGVRIAMDDFGTGYSSLSYLHAFPFDKIKIDRALRRQSRFQSAIRRHRARGDRARTRARPAGRCRGRRDRSAARIPGAGSLRRDPGLSHRPAAADREVQRTRRTRHAGTHRLAAVGEQSVAALAACHRIVSALEMYRSSRRRPTSNRS
jgi:EAL domain-containing protein (putative c-di-GMP-specific phosphodiesterase class I)